MFDRGHISSKDMDKTHNANLTVWRANVSVHMFQYVQWDSTQSIRNGSSKTLDGFY